MAFSSKYVNLYPFIINPFSFNSLNSTTHTCLRIHLGLCSDRMLAIRKGNRRKFANNHWRVAYSAMECSREGRQITRKTRWIYFLLHLSFWYSSVYTYIHTLSHHNIFNRIFFVFSFFTSLSTFSFILSPLEISAEIPRQQMSW